MQRMFDKENIRISKVNSQIGLINTQIGKQISSLHSVMQEHLQLILQ